ncbi:hypothetical protein [Bacillus cereus]|uniref:hypothetical protein n=1 Tax=Bacillus cereus TaxID=1396 RepID=UPI000BEE33E6|nr:hypothetical protein [Bacillus cereus]PDY82746.1 hypothetical protein CON06_10090 [Bacillus cereus]
MRKIVDSFEPEEVKEMIASIVSAGDPSLSCHMSEEDDFWSFVLCKKIKTTTGLIEDIIFVFLSMKKTNRRYFLLFTKMKTSSMNV